MRDFTLSQYAALLDALKAYGFHTLTLRHDVDLKPQNSLRTARLEAEKGMLGISSEKSLLWATRWAITTSH